MAKRLVLDALVKVLGEFIHISEENLNLNLAVWSGRIVLHHLKLKTDKILQSFNLHVHSGLIHTLEITIPWTALFSSPVKILVDGVYLQFGPLDPSTLNAKERRKRLLERKREKLKFADKFFDVSASGTEVEDESDGKNPSSNGKSKSMGYFQQYVAKIIDNLEITLKNIHIRYEDQYSIPGRVVSAGITLSSFILATCNDQWKVTFVARTAGKTLAKLHKLAEVKGFSIYWNTYGDAWSHYEFDEWVSLMSRSIAVENMSVPVRGLKYVLAPKNNITIKLIHQDDYDENIPKYHVTLECTNLPISLDMVQYLQLKAIINKVVYENQSHGKYSLSYRPKCRPQRGLSAVAWWKYACKLVIRRPKYIDLFKICKMNEKSSHGKLSTDERSILTHQQRFDLEHLEERIPTHVLVLLRQTALKELAHMRRASATTPATGSKTAKSWWWSTASSYESNAAPNHPDILEDDVPIDRILDEIQEDIKSKPVDESTNALLAVIQLNSSSSFELSFEGKSVLRSAMSLTVAARVTNLGITSQIDLVDFLVEDKFTPSPSIRNLISVRYRSRNKATIDTKDLLANIPSGTPRTVQSKPSSMTIYFDHYRGRSLVKVKTLPFVFCLNRDCCQMLMAMFYYQNPFDEKQEEVDQDIPVQVIEPASKTAKPSTADIEIIFEAHAPKIIVPEHSSSDSGYLLLDTGYLEVKGFLGQQGMSWAVKLRDVNAAMPLSVKDLYTFDEKYLYLIKPFDICVNVQSIDKADAGMTIDIDIQPELRGELDPKKLCRLFHLIQSITVTFLDQPKLNISTAYSDTMLHHIQDSIDDDEIEDDGLLYGTARASPVEFLEALQSDSTTQNEDKSQILSLPREDSSSKDQLCDDESSLGEFKSVLGSTSIMSQKNAPIPVNPYYVVRRIKCTLPQVVLDLTYNSSLSHHLILTLSQTAITIIMRPYDMKVLFNVNGISIEDSIRVEHQRYVAKTPQDCQFIDISYVNSSSSLSPYYRHHASEVIVNFASLALNFDIKTISHLKPFLEILIHLRGGNQSVLRDSSQLQSSNSNKEQSNSNKQTSNSSTENRLSLSKTIAAAFFSVRNKISLGRMADQERFVNRAATEDAFTPTGMIITATINAISLDILRPSSTDMESVRLDDAFSLQVSGLRAVIDMKDLLSSDVKLKSFIIFDSRDISKDYAYRTIFCPIFDSNLTSPDSSSTANSISPANDQTIDLLQIVYRQESTASAFMNVIVSNTSSFVAIDTILDLSDILMGNFFGVLDLLASPGPQRLGELLSIYLSHYNLNVDPNKSPVVPVTSTTSSNVVATSHQPLEDDFIAYTLNVSVHVNNPRLIILEDPTSEESQAMIGRCEVEIHFSRETRTFKNGSKELLESLHLTVKSLEMFVVESLFKLDDFKSILDPFGLEYHLRKQSRNGNSLSTHMSIDVDDVNARISIKDIFLIQSILTRRLMTSSSNLSDDSPSQPSAAMTNSSQQPTKTQTTASKESHNFSILLTSRPISLIAIDDSDGKSIPLLHTHLENLSFFCEGNLPVKLIGEGTLICQTDYYNSNLDAWEPFLEKWKPILVASVDDGNTLVELKCSHTLQMTLSGYILQKLSQTFLLFTNSDKNKSSIAAVSDSASNVQIWNNLGDDIDLEIMDSKSGRRLLYLPGTGECKGVVRKLKESSSTKDRIEDWTNVSGLPSAVDVNFRGSLEGKRKPILHVPFNINKPKLYNLIPTDLSKQIDSLNVSHTPGKDGKWNRMIILEPIVEETYENARYDPITGKWRKPYIFGDPDEWTDATMIASRHPQAIVINEEEWEWQDNWSVDTSGTVGVDSDVEGWEYSNSFKSFSIASKRRSFTPMDYVRRRRWIRTRVPKVSTQVNHARPLNIFWDVHIDKSGSRAVQVRSGLLVKNAMSFPIEVSLRHKLWEKDDVIYCIAPEEIFAIPLSRSFASTICMRPAWDSYKHYNWSHSIASNIQPFDFNSFKDICCEGNDTEESKSLAPVVLRALLKQDNKCLTIEFQPYIMITNVLPCDIKYRLSSSEGRKESGILVSGSTGKLVHVEASFQCLLALKVGNYSWSQKYPIDLSENNQSSTIVIEMVKKFHLPSSKVAKVAIEEETQKLLVTLNIKSSKHSRYELTIFSQSAVIDRTGLDLSIWCNINDNDAAMIKTYLTNDEISNENNNIRYPSNNPSSSSSSNNLYSVYPDESTFSESMIGSDGSTITPASKSAESSPLRTIRSDDSLLTYGRKIGDFGDNFVKQYRSNSWIEYGRSDLRGSSNIEIDSDIKSLENYLIKDLAVNSNHKYIISTLQEGSFVYSDRKLRWTHFPTIIKSSRSLCIRPSSEDAMSRVRDLIKFRLISPAIILLFVDRIMTNKCPKWISEYGFEKLVDEGVARRIEDGKLDEVFYTIYGKYFDLNMSGEEWVVLHGNWNKERGKMYSVVIIPDPRINFDKSKFLESSATSLIKQPSRKGSEIKQQNNEFLEKEFKKLLSQICFSSSYDRAIAGKSWTEGGHGLGLFHSHNDLISVGILHDKVWSNGININTNNGAPSQGYFEISDWSTNHVYQLSYKIERMPGLFHHTQVVTVMPRYCIVNCMNEPLIVAQRGLPAANKGFVIKPYHVEPWHKQDGALGNVLHFRTQSTAWSLGAVDINEGGSSVLHLPHRSAMMKKLPSNIDSLNSSRPQADEKAIAKVPFIIHVDVKEADYSENCSVVIIVWKASVHGHNAALSIRNESDVTVAIAQADIFYDVDGYDSSLFDIVVSPGQWIPFGWADPDMGSNISIVVGENLRDNYRRVATVSFLKTGELLRLPDQSGRLGHSGEVLLSIIAQGSGRILRISRMKSDRGYLSEAKADELSDNVEADGNTEKSLDIKLQLSSFGLSLVLDKPVRKEFLSLYLDGVDFTVKKIGRVRTFALDIMDMQIDNYSESRIYPVLLRSKKKEIHRSIQLTSEALDNDDQEGEENDRETDVDSQEIPVIVVTIAQEISAHPGSAPIFRYVGFRMLAIYLELDSATIQILMTDLINDFKLLSTSQIYATNDSKGWIEDYNKNLLSPSHRLMHVDLYHSQQLSQRSKMYFQKLIVHPIKLYITIIPTPDYAHVIERETIQSTFSNVFKSLAAIDRVQLKLKSFEVEDAMETKSSLIYLIGTQIRQDISSHFGQLFGSLAVIGSPMGFARKVGRGVKAFFYEPYLGLVQSPQDFLFGIGKGTSSLVSGVVSGAMNSTVAIVGTAAKGISYLSGDSEYIRKRAIKREMHRNSRRGIVEGLFDGGESLLSGIASGMTGLVTRPLEEASRDGAMGFFRGLGLGLVGAAVKPMMGFTDGIASVASGISNTVGDNASCDHVRPARAFDRSLSDTSDLIIRPLNLEAAFAQDFVLSRAKHNSYQDTFLTFIPMDLHKDSAVILSEVYVYLRKKTSLWGRPWSNISHVVYFPNEVGILMYGGVERSKPEAYSIACESKAKTIEVYSALANHSHRMGNPSLVIPVDLVEQYGLHQIKDKSQDIKNIMKGYNGLSHLNLAGEVDGYRFGLANLKSLPRITGPEIDVLRRCEYYLKLPYASLKELDERLWQTVWEWECTHTGLMPSRCCITLLLNYSDTPIQIGKIQIIHGRNVLILGSMDTGYQEESRCIQPGGSVVIFFWAFSPTPIEIGHIKAIINTAEFIVTVASTQIESSCMTQGGLAVGFLEKTADQWWSKYVVYVEN